MLLCAFAPGLAASEAPAQASEFGVEPGSFAITLSGTTAGEHADLTTAFTINQEPVNNPTGYLKDIHLSLPEGLSGNPYATPRCDMGDVEKNACPEDTAVGVVVLRTAKPPKFEGVSRATVLVYNIAPYTNEPAAYGFDAAGLAVRFDATLSGEDGYALALNATSISDVTPVIGATVTLWGVPAEHNGPGPLETSQCHINEELEIEECVTYGAPGNAPKLPFLSNPVSCGGKHASSLTVDSWQEPGAGRAETTSVAPITGCAGLAFAPSTSMAPEHAQAHVPTGYEIAVQMPGGRGPDGRASADLRSASLELPGGTVISPSAGVGLQACSAEQFHLEPPKSEPAMLPAPAPKAGECPAASEIGSVSIKTPLLAEPLTGQVFLGAPGCAPCTARDAQEGKMVRLLIQAAGSGVIVKLEGHISVGEVDGRLTADIGESPELPIEELELALKGGSNALLANPTECGSPLQGIGRLTPYSSELASNVSSLPFELTGCQGPRFAPTFEAGTVTNLADGPSTAIVSIGRTDEDQTLERFAVAMPPGLLGLLSKVPPCTQIGSCAAQSQVGTVSVAAGPGESPLQLKGAVYLTGPNGSSPFGLSIVVPAQAGPIDLGTIDIQAGIEVNPSTAALTISSDALPQSLAGVPLQIRKLNLEINRAGFMVNSTDCRPMAIAATLASTQGASATSTQHYQASGCAKLAFKPHLAALADARATRLGGASIHVKLASQPGQANVSKVKLDLPKALPSRLTTLQGACIEAIFHANPASCPASSVVGTGAVTTPFLRALLTGPVYLVSHGGRAFPDLDAVLQGEGVTLMLVGSTAFTNGASSEAFRSLPDAPISTLDLMFPEGPHSAFAANTNLCGRALNMPTAITGQNGAVVKQTIKVAVSGCARVKHSKLKRKRAKR